jgi:hypothetical protein
MEPPEFLGLSHRYGRVPRIREWVNILRVSQIFGRGKGFREYPIF